MSKTPRDHIFDILRDLTDGQFKLFKFKLCDRRLEPPIRRSEVEKADRLDIVEKLISRHTTNGAVQVTINILESMDCKELASELREITGGANSGGKASPAASPSGTTGGKHFIDIHRTALIERVRSVDGILDRLLEEEVLDQRAYDEVQAENTPQRKMMKLLSGPIHSGGKSAKDVLVKILELQECFLMDELKTPGK